MSKLIKWILIFINLIFSLLFLAAISSQYINPNEFWQFSFLGLAFPVLLIANFVFVLIWLILWKKWIWIGLISLIIGFGGLQQTLQINFKKTPPQENTSYKLLSYNVRLFDVFNWSGKEDNGINLLNFIAKEDPDIICLQEFMVNNSGKYNLSRIKEILGFAPYSYIGYNYQAFKRMHGLAIFSKYPILNGGKGLFPGTRNMYIYADVLLNTDTVRIFNNHLESIHLNQSQYNLIDSLSMNTRQTNRDELRGILSNVKNAFRRRADQTIIVREAVDNSPYPVLVCGDFNDTPVSYTYKQIGHGLKDAFIQSGFGFGASYKEFVIPLRIDYVLHSKSIQSAAYQTHAVDFSDHKPISCEISLKP